MISLQDMVGHQKVPAYNQIDIDLVKTYDQIDLQNLGNKASHPKQKNDYHEFLLYPEKYFQTFEEIVEEAGFTFESHKVTTEDGFILDVLRIKNENAPVVFLQHGLMSSADQWVANDGDTAPAFTLARLGYDVWLGNNRGNDYSKEHVEHDPHSNGRQYYNYDFEDLGKFDLPAQIDMVLEKTGVPSLTYIGHSQGTTQLFYALAKDEEKYKDKINLFIAFAPILRVGHQYDENLTAVANWSKATINTLHTLHQYGVMTQGWKDFGHKICEYIPAACELGPTFIQADSEYNGYEAELGLASKLPQAASWKQIHHYLQLIHSGEFREYDFEKPQENLDHYGQEEPPIIDVSKLKHVPIAMFVGEEDPLANTVDCRWARDEIPTTFHYQEVPNCDHGTFLTGKDMRFMSDVLRIIAQHRTHKSHYHQVKWLSGFGHT